MGLPQLDAELGVADARAAEKAALLARVAALRDEVSSLRQTAPPVREVRGVPVPLPAAASVHRGEVTAVDERGCWVAVLGYGSGRVRLTDLSRRVVVLYTPPASGDGAPPELCTAVLRTQRLGPLGPDQVFYGAPLLFHPATLLSVGERVWVEVVGSEAGQLHLSLADVDQRSGARLPPLPDVPVAGQLARGVVSVTGVGHTDDDGTVIVLLPGFKEARGLRPVGGHFSFATITLCGRLHTCIDRRLPLRAGDIAPGCSPTGRSIGARWATAGSPGLCSSATRYPHPSPNPDPDP